MQSSPLPINLGDSFYSLSISAVLIFSFVLWFVWSFFSKRFVYRLTGIEIGLGIFCIAAVAAGFMAANKRLAITNVAVFLAPTLMALLLVQILDSQSKVKLLLVVIATLGVVSAYQCAEQFFISNQMTIEQYEQDPQSLLEPLGIEPDTFQHFLFEHRLYSRGVRGFFTTRNSAGSFALMASFAAIALFIDKLKNRKSDSSPPLHLLACGIAAAIVIFGLALTRSKGAIIGSLFAAAMFIVYLRFGNWLRAHKKSVVITCLLLAIAGNWVVVSYGLNHSRLPGGSSMLVRWQYWHASAKMYADHPITGVGPGNFAHSYTHYKPAEALESVADPHNFPLSILTQYGPIGLVGFLAMIFIALWRTISPNPLSSSPKAHRPEPAPKILAVTFLIIISAALLLIRPMLMPATPADTFEVIIYVVVTLYAVPVAAFIIGFFLLTVPLRTTRNTQYAIRNTNITAALFCAVLGVLVHNLIDFAIFEPGVFTVFWVIIACLIAIDSQTNPRPQVVLKPAPFVKILIGAAGVVITCVYLNYVLIPAAKASAKIQRANRAISVGRFEQAHKLLDYAAEDDSLSPVALSLNGRLYLHHFQLTSGVNRDLLLQAEKCLRVAIERNSAAFKNFERLTEVYFLLAEISTQQEKIYWLNKAFGNASFAVEHRYPGCARLRIELAKIAERLGKTDVAIKQYKNAIDIEDKYREQFREMYPEREKIVSRLGEEKYQFAKQRLKFLKDQSTP